MEAPLIIDLEQSITQEDRQIILVRQNRKVKGGGGIEGTSSSNCCKCCLLCMISMRLQTSLIWNKALQEKTDKSFWSDRKARQKTQTGKGREQQGEKSEIYSRERERVAIIIKPLPTKTCISSAMEERPRMQKPYKLYRG